MSLPEVHGTAMESELTTGWMLCYYGSNREASH